MDKSNITTKLNEAIALGSSANGLEGFEKAYQLAEASDMLMKTLSSDYMKPILKLQNTKLGFKTDRDAGYPEEVVRNCLIEAVLTGVQPVGNHFNIIANNCYITKEGFGYLLSNIKGLSWEIIPNLPRLGKENSTSGAVVMIIKWSINGVSSEREIDFGVKINKFMGADAVIGKATRKARAWLYQTITGNEISEGETETIDIPHVDIYSKKESLRDKQGKINMP